MRNRTGILAMVIVILISNAVVLIGIVRARSGEPIQTIELTERELPLESLGQDNSGIALRYNWTNRQFNIGQNQTNSEDYFDQAKLEELGFRLMQPPAGVSEHHKPLPRTAFVALEYDGDSWQRWLRKSETDLEKTGPQRPNDVGPKSRSQSWDPARRQRMASRLFLVDVGRSYEQLRQKYPDQQKYVIARAVVRATLNKTREANADKTAPPKWRGYVTEILPTEIFVPSPYAKMLTGLAAQTAEAPRYTVTLRYGRTVEPWVADVRLGNR